MKKIVLFSIVFGLFLVLGFLMPLSESGFYALSRPLTIVADGLRALSLKNGLYNVLAIMLFSAIGFLPFIGLLWIKKNQKHLLMMSGLSISLFLALYFMINPHFIYQGSLINQFGLTEAIVPLLNSSLAFMVYTVIALILFLKFFDLSVKGMASTFTVLAYGFITGLIVLLAYQVLPTLINDLFASEHSSEAVYHFLMIVYSMLTYGFMVLIIYYGKAFMLTLITMDFDQESYLLTIKLMRLSKAFILVLLSGALVINGWQLIFFSNFSHTTFSFELPLFSILLAFIFYSLTLYTNRVVSMKEEIELVI